MERILLKTMVLVFIILSVYFIVNQSACSNFLAGRVVLPEGNQVAHTNDAGEHGELFTPMGDKPLRTDNQPTPGNTMEQTEKQFNDASVADISTHEMQSAEVVGITDTNTFVEPELIQNPEYSQAEIDWAVASRYVELENESIKLGKMEKDTAKKNSAQVMDDFEMTQQEWNAFLERATATNLFDQVRTQAKAVQANLGQAQTKLQEAQSSAKSLVTPTASTTTQPFPQAQK